MVRRSEERSCLLSEYVLINTSEKNGEKEAAPSTQPSAGKLRGMIPTTCSTAGVRAQRRGQAPAPRCRKFSYKSPFRVSHHGAALVRVSRDPGYYRRETIGCSLSGAPCNESRAVGGSDLSYRQVSCPCSCLFS